MAEYIEREAFLKDIEERYCSPCKEAGEYRNGFMCGGCWVNDMCGDVIDAPAADVAPAPRWIKVEDELPTFVEDVLLLFESSMAVGYLREKHDGETAWDISDENGCGIDAHSKPLYWMPLPKRPKE